MDCYSPKDIEKEYGAQGTGRCSDQVNPIGLSADGRERSVYFSEKDTSKEEWKK
jgi:hypothetical protein